MLWDVWGDSMCVCFMQKTSVAANCRATNVWQLPALCASHLLYACSHEWARSLWTIAVSVRTEHKEKEKKKSLLLSFLTCRRFCVGCWCKPHVLSFFLCVFPSHLSLWCLSLDLRLFLQLFLMIFWMEDWNTMNFRGSTPFDMKKIRGKL